jgi:cytochrome c peroxidase
VCLVAVALTSCAPSARRGMPAATPVMTAVQPRSREPISPIPPSADYNPEVVALGSMLFHDVRLSHDDTISCASCHGLATGGVDRRQHSIGIDGQSGARNAPNVFNSGLNFRQFWDGRSGTLEEQIDGPTAGPREMGSSWPEILAKLQHSDEYPALFAELYSDGITIAATKNALATFERSLNTPNARFDRYLEGDATALTAHELAGYQAFKSFGCVSCHQGTNVGGNMYQRLGVMEQLAPGITLMSDSGRFGVTGDARDELVF